MQKQSKLQPRTLKRFKKCLEAFEIPITSWNYGFAHAIAWSTSLQAITPYLSAKFAKVPGLDKLAFFYSRNLTSVSAQPIAAGCTMQCLPRMHRVSCTVATRNPSAS